jgi:hypothetical protein
MQLKFTHSAARALEHLHNTLALKIIESMPTIHPMTCTWCLSSLNTCAAPGAPAPLPARVPPPSLRRPSAPPFRINSATPASPFSEFLLPSSRSRGIRHPSHPPRTLLGLAQKVWRVGPCWDEGSHSRSGNHSRVRRGFSVTFTPCSSGILAKFAQVLR